MKLTEHTPYPDAGFLSHIEIDKETLVKIGINENTNVFVPSPSVPIAFRGDIGRAIEIAEAWHGHFKHLILAMPALIEAANNLCNKINGLNAEPVLEEFNALCDALEPYKNVL